MSAVAPEFQLITEKSAAKRESMVRWNDKTNSKSQLPELLGRTREP